jgi:hypothetical protein
VFAAKEKAVEQNLIVFNEEISCPQTLQGFLNSQKALPQTLQGFANSHKPDCKLLQVFETIALSHIR